MSSKDKFNNIGKKVIRNILNIQSINEELNQFIKDKNIENYPNIEIWIKTVVKNYILQKINVNEENKENLSLDIQQLIETKKIAPPYHIINISAQFKDKVSHCIDYLQSDFTKEKDLNRISFEQAEINAQSWLSKRLKNLSKEDDKVNVKTVKEFNHNGQEYRWVNIRSHKALGYEAKLMNNCIETYWEKDFPGLEFIEEESPYYSLRDKNNKPIVTLFRKLKNNLDEEEIFFITEIKEKNNEYLSHKNRELVDILLEGKNVDMNSSEKELSHYYTVFSPGDTDFSTKRVVSINEIIKNNIDYLSNKSMYIEEFEEFFDKKSLYKLIKWEKIKVSGADESNHLRAKEIELVNIENQSIQTYSNQLHAKDMKNCKIYISSVKETISQRIRSENTFKNQDVIRIFENLSDCEIHISQSENNEFYIFKNCKNIKIKGNLSIINNNSINIIKKDSIQIKLEEISQNKNIFEIDGNDYKYIITNNEKSISSSSLEDVKNENYINIKNEFISKLVNRYIKISSSEDILFDKFKKQIKFNIKNEKAYFNNYLIEGNLKDILIKLFKDSDNFLIEEFKKYEKDHYENYQDFIKNNAFNIMKNELGNIFLESQKYISEVDNEIKNLLVKNRELLIKTLTNEEDNFADYIYNIFSPNIITNDKLLIYKVKNEILDYAIKNVEPSNACYHRFAMKEQRLNKSTAKRWIDYILENVEKAEWKNNKKELLDILMQPFDNNKLIDNMKSNIKIKFKI